MVQGGARYPLGPGPLVWAGLGVLARALRRRLHGVAAGVEHLFSAARRYKGWVWEPALTSEDLAEYRRIMTTLNAVDGSVTAETKYTCDSCSVAPHRTLAFEPYNTDGDCLADK
jgi:hypothetical protein